MSELEKTVNLRQKAYEIIKHKIIYCELMPGTPISEKTLMNDIQASRTPIREALSILEKEGLVKIYDKRGVFVTDVSVKDAIDLYTVSESIEPLAARLATPNIDLDKVNEYHKLYTDPNYETSAEEHINVDRSFHTLIAHYTNNSYLETMLSWIFDHNRRIRTISLLKQKERQAEARQEHIEVILRFMERDAVGAEEAMRRHIKKSKEVIVQALMGL